MADDPRLRAYEPGDSITVELTESYQFFAALCDAYPQAQYPAVDDLPELLRRAGEELPRRRCEDHAPVHIAEASIMELAEAMHERFQAEE